jgi:phage shock protein PspC (stress-responsive transcriptional regulator)
MLAGVAAGVAETLDADPSLVRIAWAVLAILTGGIAILVYIVMAIIVPEAPSEPWEPWQPGSAWPGSGAPGGGLPPAPPAPPEIAGPPATAGTPIAASASPAPEIEPSAVNPPAIQTRAEWHASQRAARRARRRERMDSGETGLIVGVVLIAIGALFLVRQAIPWFDFHVWWPLGIVGLGVLLLAVALRPGRPGD